MLVRPDEKVPIARLLTFLEHEERMAHDCARGEAALASDAGDAGFSPVKRARKLGTRWCFRPRLSGLPPGTLVMPLFFRLCRSTGRFSSMR